MFDLCAPALIYIAFSLTQIIVDTFKGLYNTAIVKLFVSVIITLMLNTLCKTGMGIISWIIVFIPFIFMTVIVGILLYTFGLDPATGKLNIQCTNCDKNNNGQKIINTSGKDGNLIFVSKKTDSAKYIDVTYSEQTLDDAPEVWTSSDPQY
uniref:Uncharacterized protein n=1 Tax=viral metagenome TaxID=1070528 RepID=A0A6C0ITU3_9ZZZZ